MRWEMAKQLAPEAFRDALARYKDDTEGALIFFGYAIGLGIAKPTAADIARAQERVAVTRPQLTPLGRAAVELAKEQQS